jgi:exodeoxyribonuclease VII small subunit
MSGKPTKRHNDLDDNKVAGATRDQEEEIRSDLSFEEALRELDEIVDVLEAGNIPLEQSLELLQRGMALAAQCDSTLSRAEATLEQLVATSDGELVTQRVAWNDEDENDEDDEEDE